MPAALHVNALTAHLQPLAPGPGSPIVSFDSQPAWRALPAGVGAGLETATSSVKELMDKPQLTPPEVMPKLVKMQADFTDSATAAAAECANTTAVNGVTSTFATLQTTHATLMATWTAAQPTPGAAAATTAYTLAIKAALNGAASGAVSAIAGTMDMSMCAMPGGPPHGPGLVTRGSIRVFIDGLPAAHQGNQVFEAAGGPVDVKVASFTVVIED